MNILSVKNLSKIYGDENNHVIALDNVSFDVEIGEFIAIIGASGSGKSTLLHQIGGVDHPSSGKLSGGQQQRVSIARALINQPSLVLADEPTGNLDSKNSDEIIRLLKEANEKYHQTIIIITHDNNIAKLANRVITIKDGKIISDLKRGG